jgi:hypothetical protein
MTPTSSPLFASAPDRGPPTVKFPCAGLTGGPLLALGAGPATTIFAGGHLI